MSKKSQIPILPPIDTKKPPLKRYDIEVVIPSITADSPEEAIETIAEFYPIRKDWVVTVWDSDTKKEVEF